MLILKRPPLPGVPSGQLIPTNVRVTSGFSLVELMIVLVVLGILVGLGGPSFVTMLQNLKVRSTAEALSGALQLARSEAVRTNGTVIFQLVNSLDNSCAQDANGRFWVVSLCAATSMCGEEPKRDNQRPAGGCDDKALILAKGALEGGDKAEVTIANGLMCYSSLGRIDPTIANCPDGSLNPLDASLGGKVTINIKSTQASCVTDGGDVRCLQINIGAGGESRLCDPAVLTTGDPRKC